MKLVIGIGNPEKKYSKTRHNVGFMALDAIASSVNGGRWIVNRKLGCSLFTVHESIIIAKPMIFMNSSGIAVKKLTTYYKLHTTDLYIIHDDLDISLGSYKIQFGKGPRNHNGLLSIYEKLGTRDFWHVRIGIENREFSQITNHRSPVTSRLSGETYVLQPFKEDEFEILNGVIDKVTVDLRDRLTE